MFPTDTGLVFPHVQRVKPAEVRSSSHQEHLKEAVPGAKVSDLVGCASGLNKDLMTLLLFIECSGFLL